jgi:hypothetical protein
MRIHFWNIRSGNSWCWWCRSETPLFLLQKNYYTKLPIKQYLKQPKN